MRYQHFVALFLLLSFPALLIFGASEYHMEPRVLLVKPTNNTYCPGEPCLTLAEYVQNATQYFESYVTMKFLPGDHVLSQLMMVTSVVNFALVLENSSQVHNTSIICRLVGNTHRNAFLFFSDSQNVTIDGLRFYSCGGFESLTRCYFATEDIPAGSLEFYNVTNLKLSNITVEHSLSHGVCAVNVLGTFSIVGANFSSNSGGSPHVSVIHYDNSTTLTSVENTTFASGVAGALCFNVSSMDISLINVSTMGMNAHSNIPLSSRTDDIGINLYMICTENCPTSSLYINESQISHHVNGGIRLAGAKSLQSIVEDTVISQNTASGENAGGFTITHADNVYSMCGTLSTTTTEDTDSRNNTENQLTSVIEDPVRKQSKASGEENAGAFTTTDTDNTSSSLSASTTATDNTTSLTLNDIIESQPIILRNVTFSYNSYSPTVEGDVIAPILSVDNSARSISFIQCEFVANHGSVVLQGSSGVTFTDSSFLSNMAPGILAVYSNFTLSGDIHFVNNSAYQGGGLAFYGRSFMLVDSSYTNILFANNTVTDVGGAIYIDGATSSVVLSQRHANTDCFMKLTSISSKISLMFRNNTSENGGDDIYGGLVYACTIYPGFEVDPHYIVGFLHFDPLVSNISSLTSAPSRVCLCKEGKPDCLIVFSEGAVASYPGQTITLPAAVVGERFGTVRGSVSAQLLRFDSDSGMPPALGPLQYSQAVVPHNCTELKYNIFSSNMQEVLTLMTKDISLQSMPDKKDVDNDIANYNSTGDISLNLLSYPVFINITLRRCPLGFQLASQLGSCVCDPQLTKDSITCIIDDQTVHRSGTLWVNASFNGSDSNGVIIGKHCPYSYCKSEEVDVNLYNPDSQCDFNHSGILCGSCQVGFSLALGSPQCLRCSNTYLSLLVPFAIAGFALVFFIRFLNLTVSKGTINGLVFYANIVGAIPSMFFPPNIRNPLTVFIAWLNLDLGIETCLYDGLDAYWKMWLQFTFPFYVWGIAGLIIIASHYSSIATRLFGYNSVPLLATLILLSYAKLLRIIIAAFSVNRVEYPTGSQLVWSPDGNVEYLHSRHIYLFIAAVCILLFLWLPYTIVLTVGQHLQKVRWVARMKPFFDAYHGPFKDKHRYWVGVLLLVRVFLFLAFAIFAPSVGQLLVCVTSIAILMYLNTIGNVFKNWHLSLLQNSFFLNLGVLSAATLLIHSSGGNQAAVVYTSVGIVFAQFVGIVVFHTWVLLRNSKWSKKTFCRENELEINRAGYDAIPGHENCAGFQSQMGDVDEYREPLLGLDDN